MINRFFIIILVGIGCIASTNAANPRSDAMIKRLSHQMKLSETDDFGFTLKNRAQAVDKWSFATPFGTMHTPASDDNDENGEENSITHYPVILEIKKGGDASEILRQLDAVVYYHRGNLYLTSIPIENLEEIPRNAGIDTYQLSTYSAPALDVARSVSNVDIVHSQNKTLERVRIQDSHAVVTGICDTGFDPRHEAFSNCLKRWVIYDEYRGARVEYDGYDDIISNGPETDNIASPHATHVAGIIAGYAEQVPYYGIAPASDFVATSSQLSDVGICCGIEDVIAYAKETGRPAIVNISAGSYLGPHDGKDLVGRYLSALAEDAVIVFSAGNYGERLNCQTLDLDDYSSFVGSTWCGTSWTGFDVYGGTDMWSRDDTPFEFRLVIWDTNEKSYKFVTEWLGGDGNDGEIFLDLENTDWFTYGGLWATWGVYEGNNRFNVAVEYDYLSEALQTAGPWARYAVAYQIRKVDGTSGTHVDVYADGIYSFLHGRGFGVEGSLAGTPDGSISNLACSPDVFAVGAWNSRSTVPDVTSGERDWNNNVNTVAVWSSWGTSGDGRTLPHLCAPGNTLVSALSSPHANSESVSYDAQFIAYEHDGFRYFATAGTSMSAPMTTGILALWLERNPALSVSQLQDIAMTTANRNFDDIDNPRWGAGAIDAKAGLDYIDTTLGVANVTSESGSPSINLINGIVTITWAGVQNPKVEIFDLTGRRISGNKVPAATPCIIMVSDTDSSRQFSFKVLN